MNIMQLKQYEAPQIEIIKLEIEDVVLIGTSSAEAEEFNVRENSATYKIGDLYPNAINPIGVVFAISDQVGAHGKIISLDEVTNTQWSTEFIATGATSNTDGAANTAKIFTIESYKEDNSKYPLFKWCAIKNGLVPVGIKWYIPAKIELEGEIWANKATLNTSLSNIEGAAQLTTNYYWSSTEGSDNSAWDFYFDSGSSYYNVKISKCIVRFVSTF